MGFSEVVTETLNAHILDVHLPNVLIGIGGSIEVPLITVLGRRIQANHSQIANFVLLSAVCRTALDIPFGVVVEYVGVRNVMMACLVANAVAALIGTHIASFAMLGIYCVLCGISLGGFFLSRHIFVAGISSKKYRGMLMSFLSGLLRWAHVIGPLLTGLIASKTGDVRNAFYVAAVTAVASLLSLLAASWTRAGPPPADAGRVSIVPTPIPSDGDEHVGEELVAAAGADPATQVHMVPGTPQCGGDAAGAVPAEEVHYFRLSALWNTILSHWGIIWRLGLYIIVYTALRSNRKLMLMFSGMRENMTDAQISYLLSFSFIFDALLFPLGGLIMDFMGRQIAMAPVLIGLAAAFVALPWCRTPTSLYAVSAAFGIADAMGCGLVMTLTADRAPKVHGAPFFGVMRTLGDLGHVVGAGGVSFLVRTVGHDHTCLVLAATGVLTALWGVLGVPRDMEPMDTPKVGHSAAKDEHSDTLQLPPPVMGEERPLLSVDAHTHRGSAPQYGGV